MPVIQGKNANAPTSEFTGWGSCRLKKGMANVTELHHHDCDEFVFVIEGRLIMRSEGILYTLEKGDVLATRMGDEHEVVEVIEDTVYFWLETELRGQKRRGHLHRAQGDA